MLSRNVSYDGLMRWGVELIHYLNGCGKGLDIARRLVVGDIGFESSEPIEYRWKDKRCRKGSARLDSTSKAIAHN
jgi:hypothetical protein